MDEALFAQLQHTWRNAPVDVRAARVNHHILAAYLGRDYKGLQDAPLLNARRPYRSERKVLLGVQESDHSHLEVSLASLEACVPGAVYLALYPQADPAGPFEGLLCRQSGTVFVLRFFEDHPQEPLSFTIRPACAQDPLGKRYPMVVDCEAGFAGHGQGQTRWLYGVPDAHWQDLQGWLDRWLP